MTATYAENGSAAPPPRQRMSTTTKRWLLTALAVIIVAGLSVVGYVAYTYWWTPYHAEKTSCRDFVRMNAHERQRTINNMLGTADTPARVRVESAQEAYALCRGTHTEPDDALEYVLGP